MPELSPELEPQEALDPQTIDQILADLEGFGIADTDQLISITVKGKKVESFIEKPQEGQGFINGGFFIVNRKFLDYLTESEQCDLESGALEQLAKEGQLMMYTHEGFWGCMDTWRDMEHLNKLWSEGKAPWIKLP